MQLNRITLKPTADAAETVDNWYELLLLQIALAIVSTTPAAKTAAATAAVGTMHRLARAASQITQLARQTAGDFTALAGPTFTFPQAGLPADITSINDRIAALEAVLQPPP